MPGIARSIGKDIIKLGEIYCILVDGNRYYEEK